MQPADVQEACAQADIFDQSDTVTQLGPTHNNCTLAMNVTHYYDILKTAVVIKGRTSTLQ